MFFQLCFGHSSSGLLSLVNGPYETVSGRQIKERAVLAQNKYFSSCSKKTLKTKSAELVPSTALTCSYVGENRIWPVAEGTIS